VDEYRKVATDYPKLLLGYKIGAYSGKVTLLIPEESHRQFGNQGWEKAETGGLDVHVLPGDHVTYIRDHAASTAARLRAIIDRANLEVL
jgi:thioesterase domain-containing protein